MPLSIDNVGALIRTNYLGLNLIVRDKLYKFGYLTANTSAISLINHSNLLLLKLVDTETFIRFHKTLNAVLSMQCTNNYKGFQHMFKNKQCRFQTFLLSDRRVGLTLGVLLITFYNFLCQSLYFELTER